MTTVTIKAPVDGLIARTPSEELTAGANAQFSVTDLQSRVIVLKKPGVVVQFDLDEALADLA